MSSHRTPRHSCLLASGFLLFPFVASAGTVAYYRFENGSAGQPVGNAVERSVLDVSGNNRHLTPFQNPVLSADIPSARIPLTGETNTLSARFTGREEILESPDGDLNRIAFTDFTIEAWVKFDSLNGWQTFIGRDDSGNPGEGHDAQALFYFSKTIHSKPNAHQIENAFRIEAVIRDNRLIAFDSSFVAQLQTWYHVAVVGDSKAGTLSLFVDGTKLGEATEFNGLFVPSRNSPWTFGRGQYQGRPMDRFVGSLDEVRFSDEALTPDRFLNATPPPPPPPPPPVVAPVVEEQAPAPAPQTTPRRGFWRRLFGS